MTNSCRCTKPVDKRKATRNATRTVLSIDENIAVKGISSVANKIEVDNPDNAYYAEGITHASFNAGIFETAHKYGFRLSTAIKYRCTKCYFECV